MKTKNLSRVLTPICLVFLSACFCTSLEQPILISPSEGEVVMTSIPEFIWHSVNNARFYSIQISKSADFADPIDTLVFSDTSLQLVDTLDLGTTYYWRVTAESVQGGESESSETGTFKIEKGVELVTPEAFDSTAWPVFSWESFSGASAYDMQISKYADFRELFFNNSLAETSYVFSDSLVPGTYYWRVRAFISEQPASAWSRVRMLVSYRLSDTYFPFTLDRNIAYNLTHIEGRSRGEYPNFESETTSIETMETTVSITDSFRLHDRLYWILSDKYADIGDTVSVHYDSIFSPHDFLGYLYPPDDTGTYRFNSWDSEPFKVIYDVEGLILTKRMGTKGSSGYDSIGILRIPGVGVGRQVNIVADIPDTSTDWYEWEVDSLELK